LVLLNGTFSPHHAQLHKGNLADSLSLFKGMKTRALVPRNKAFSSSKLAFVEAGNIKIRDNLAENKKKGCAYLL